MADSGIYIDRPGVDPARQGSGLGSFMLVRIEEIARSSGLKGLSLETAEMAEGNIRLYRRHGFEIVRTDGQTMVLPGYVSQFTTTFDAGEYLITCNEYCGVGHHTMAAKLHVVPGDGRLAVDAHRDAALARERQDVGHRFVGHGAKVEASTWWGPRPRPAKRASPNDRQYMGRRRCVRRRDGNGGHAAMSRANSISGRSPLLVGDRPRVLHGARLHDVLHHGLGCRAPDAGHEGPARRGSRSGRRWPASP